MSISQVNGVRQNYGTRDLESGLGSPVTFGAVKQAVAEFTYDKLPAAGSIGDAVILELPARAVVTSAKLIVTAPFVGGTSLSVGTKNAATGAAIDDAGLITAAAGAVASLIDGAVLVGAGAQINKTVSTTLKSKVAVTAAGTFTAGKAVLVVEYITV